MLSETDVGVGPAFAGHNDFRLGIGGEAGVVAAAGCILALPARRARDLLRAGRHGSRLRARVAQAFSIATGLALRFSVETAGAYAQASTELVGYF